MGISRKDALRKIIGLTPRIQEHVEKTRAMPSALDYNHWQAELGGWLRDVERWARHIGRRSQEEVMHDVKQWKEAAGIQDD